MTIEEKICGMKMYKLGDLCSDVVDCPHSTPEWKNEGIRVIRNFNIVNGSLDFSNGFFVDEETFEKRTQRACPEFEDLVISREAPMGAVCLIPKNLKCCLGQRLVLLKINKELADPNYILFAIQSQFVQKQIRIIDQTGSIVSNLNIPDLKSLRIPLPSLPEQKKIASVLSALDKKIALNKKMNQKLEAMAKRLYDYWFVQFDFPDKNGHPYKTTGGPMTYNPTLKREIPAGWKVKQICDIASFEKESVCPSDNPCIEYKHFSIPGYDECGSYVLEKGESILSDKFKVSEIDILVSKLNPWTSRVIWGETQENQICSTEFVVMKLHELKEKGFLYSLVKQPSFIDYCTRGSSGTSHSHRRVNPEYMMDYIFAYDKDVVQRFSAIVSRYALMMMKNLRENRRLIALRDKLLPLLMNGPVEVCG